MSGIRGSSHSRGQSWSSHGRCSNIFKRIVAIDKSDKFMVKKAVSNAIVSNVGGTSIKPCQMYEMIEALVPAGPYLELFGRVNNRREGWVTAGNEAIALQKNDK